VSDSINANITALITNNLDNTMSKMQVSLNRLSSGLRITPKDDISAFILSTKLQSQIYGLQSARSNANDAISLTQITQSAVQGTIDILQHVRALAVQAANGSNTSVDRAALQVQINDMKNAMSGISAQTSFNNLNLLNGSVPSIDFQIGANANQLLMLGLPNTSTSNIGSNDLATRAGDSITQANYQVYQEANGTNITVNSGLTNALTSASTITLTPVNSNGTSGLATVITPTNGSTAAQLAATINATSLAQASGYTAVSLTGFAISGNANNITLGINTSNGVNIAGPVLSSATIGGSDAQTYSNVATLINASANMRANGIYAIASATDVKIISTSGYDITASSTGTATLAGMQILSSTATNVGSSATLTAGSSSTATGILSLGTGQNVNVSFGNTGIFNNATQVNAGVRDTQTINRLQEQTLIISGNTGTSNVTLTASQSAVSVAVAINNATSTTGVSATAQTTALIKGLSASGTVGFQLKADNNTLATVSASITTGDYTALIKAVNDVSGTTGITAKTSGANNVIELDNALGNDIQILNFTHSAAIVAPSVSALTPVAGDGSTLALPAFASIQVVGDSGSAVTLFSGGARNNVDSTTVGGSVTFHSASAFAVHSAIDGLTYSGSLFNTAANANSASSFSSVANIDISTSSGAQDAISVLDQAINQLTIASAGLGAAHSGFASTIANLTNMASAFEETHAKIADADFAAETAQLTKMQILASVGVALLAQANGMQREYLKLLNK
jgi:flagellin